LGIVELFESAQGQSEQRQCERIAGFLGEGEPEFLDGEVVAMLSEEEFSACQVSIHPRKRPRAPERCRTPAIASGE
jgi:hypothetical protein